MSRNVKVYKNLPFSCDPDTRKRWHTVANWMNLSLGACIRKLVTDKYVELLKLGYEEKTPNPNEIAQ